MEGGQPIGIVTALDAKPRACRTVCKIFPASTEENQLNGEADIPAYWVCFTPIQFRVSEPSEAEISSHNL